MANVIEIILKGTDKASKEFSKVQKATKGISEAFVGMSAAAVGIAGVGAAVKKAFDFGREGAVIEQTGESFDFLMEKVGAAPDLLDQLTAASHGTISAFELQSSTMTLLAGAQGELGTALANATPKLLEIAKAANKLNPALGTTSFMYESIATGVKRAQPLILDNLGLTLKVGEANKAYAESIGKTVEEMTAQDKAMAILNATIEAGDTLIDQVGGTTEAATDSFDQLDVSMNEIVDTIKKGLYPHLNKAADALLLIMKRQKMLDGVLDDHIDNLLVTTESYEDFVEQVLLAEDAMRTELIPGAEGAANILDFFGLITRDTTSVLDEWTNQLYLSAVATAESDEVSRKYVDTYSALIPVIEAASEETDKFAEIILEEMSAAEKATAANKKFLDGIDRDLASPIDSFVKDIEWFLATGGQFEAAWARIQALAKTAPEEALGMAQELLVMIEDSRAELNMTTGDEAAKNIADTLGIELWEANQMIRGTDGLHESMAGLGDIYIDLSELERMEAITLRILDNLTLMRTPGIQIGVPGQGFPAETGDPVERPGTTPGGEPTDIPRHENIPEFTTGGASITQNFTVNNELDIEEIAARLAEV